MKNGILIDPEDYKFDSLKDVLPEKNQYNLYNILNGIYSGFPLCCIYNYCELESHGHAPWMFMLEKYPYLIQFDLNYVPCDKCIAEQDFVHNDKLNKGIIDPEYVKEFLKLLK